MEGIWLHEATGPGQYYSVGINQVVAKEDSAFQKCIIADTTNLGRAMYLDNQMQSAQVDEPIYHESLVHPAMLAHPNPQRVFIGGGGEGATAREVLRHKTVKECVMVDIDPVVVKLAKEHMADWHQGAFEDPRMKLIVDDAKKILEGYDDGYFDVIILDLADPLDHGPCYTLYTTEFYKTCSQKLSPEGTFVTQSGPGNLLDFKMCFAPVHNTLKASVFPFVAPYTTHIESFAGLWSFTIACKKVSESKESCLAADKLSTLDPEEVDKTIAARYDASKLQHYDGLTHRKMFTLQKMRRLGLAKEERVISEKTPIYIEYCHTEIDNVEKKKAEAEKPAAE